jgi:hypothetical protein
MVTAVKALENKEEIKDSLLQELAKKLLCINLNKCQMKKYLIYTPK